MMTDLIPSLQIFDVVQKKGVFSTYENSKGFISGSFEEHLLNIVLNPNKTKAAYTNIINELKESFSEGYNKRACVAIDYDLLFRDSKASINYDNLYVTSAFVLGEVFDYAESTGTDVSQFREKFDVSINNIKTKMEELDKYFEELEKISYLCSKFRKAARTNEEKGIALFNQIKEILDNPNSLINKITYNTDFNYMSTAGIIKDLTDLQGIRNDIVRTIKENRTNNSVLTLADTYVLNQDKISTVQQAVLDISILANIEFTASQKISGMIFFTDSSICYKEKNGKYVSPESHDEVSGKIRLLHESTIDYLLRKKPQVAKSFIEKLKENESSSQTIINTINRYLENETLVKNYLKQDYEVFFKDLMANKSVEVFDDQFTKMADKQKFQIFAYSIASKKYRHLYNETSMTLLEDIYNNNKDPEQLQIYVGKKIAAFKTPEDFNSYLTRYLSKINGFDPDLIVESVEKHEATIVSNNKDVLIVETTNYEQMSNLGSNSWCIVRDEGYFDDYVCDGNRQYIVFDFNKLSSDVESMIGITLSPDGTYRNAHVKNDDSIDANEVEKFTDVIIMAQRETYKDLDKELEERLYPEVKKINKLKIA